MQIEYTELTIVSTNSYIVLHIVYISYWHEMIIGSLVDATVHIHFILYSYIIYHIQVPISTRYLGAIYL